ncbi:MAG: PilZ domain-containing protein [Planctomycetota bacterium]
MSHEKTSLEVVEKRRFLRLDDYFKVSFHRTDDFGGHDEERHDSVGYSKNISLGGIAFVTDRELTLGDVIAAEVSIPEIDRPIDFVGEVVRLTPMPEGDRWDVGVKFLPFGIDDERRGELELFIYEHFLKDPLL